MEEKIQERADLITSAIMSRIYGKRFDNCEDLTEDEEMNKDWEFYNEKVFGELWAMYDDGVAAGQEFRH